MLENPELAAVAARLPVKIEFIRDCSEVGAKMNLPGGKIILLKSTPYEYSPNDSSPLKITLPNTVRLIEDENMLYCDYYAKRELRVYMRPNDVDPGMVALSDTVDPSIYTID